MQNVFLSIISAVIGGTLVAIIREVIIVRKENNTALRIAKVTLTNELKKNHNNLVKKNNAGKSVKDYIEEQAGYGHSKLDFTNDNWEKTKVDIAKMNPELGELLYKTYTFYEKLTISDFTSEIDQSLLNEYEINYPKVLDKFNQ